MPVGNPEIGDEGDANPHIYQLIASNTLTIIEQGECPICGHPVVDQYVVEIYRHQWGFSIQVLIGHPGAMGEPSGCYHSYPVCARRPQGQYVHHILKERWGTMTPADAQPPAPPPPPPPQPINADPIIVDANPNGDGNPPADELDGL